MKPKNNLNKNQNFCDICQQTILGSSYKFKSHLYKHNAVAARFKCSLCSKEFFRSDVYSKHMENHSGTAKKKTFVCDYCDRGFVNKRNLMIHLKVHDDNFGFQYKCVACGVTYCEERLLKYHIRKTHYNLHSKESSHLKKQLNETWVEPVKESQIYVQMTKINNNVLSIKKFSSVKQEVESKFNVPDEKTKFKEYMSSVFAQKDNSQYSKAKCDYCHKEMLKKSIRSHIRERHLKLRRFKCDKCKRTFMRHYQMVDHVCEKPKRRRK